MQHRFTRIKQHPNNIEDIYDGRLYKEHSRPGGLLSSPSNISLFWYTDGIPLFKSSSMSLWPLYFTINELPYKKRMLKENTLIAGLWFGESKPCMGTFLKPFDTTLKTLGNGFDAVLYDGRHVNVKAILLGGTCDMPAKGQVLNMVQFNGFYGCPKCLQPGETVPSGNGHTHAYPYDRHNPSGPARTIEGFRDAAEKAYEQSERVEGINGPSWFLYLTDVVRGTALDYMHQVLLGVTRKLTHLWFDSQHHREGYSLSKSLKAVNDRFMEIKPPNFISRPPTSLYKLKFWKASEFRSWLFYYSAPVLFGFLPSIYYQHHLLLIEAIYILNSESISPADIDRCDRIFEHYCFLFATLYGIHNMSINTHSILHLTDVVRDLGPLYIYSCFPYESLNGDIKNLFHGTQAVDKQVANAVGILIKLPVFVNTVNERVSPATIFLKKLRGSAQVDGIHVEKFNFDILGSMKQKKLNHDELVSLRQYVNAASDKALYFLRFSRGRRIFSSFMYKRQFVRNSSVVAFRQQERTHFGQVQFYFQYPEDCMCLELPCTCLNYYAVVKQFDSSDLKLAEDDLTGVTVKHIVVCKVLSAAHSIEVVPVTAITNVCVFMNFKNQDQVFIAQPPNLLESD